jgi:hypothetical protein
LRLNVRDGPVSPQIRRQRDIEGNGLSRGAAVAYHAVFSLALVLIIVIPIAGFVFGADAERSSTRSLGVVQIRVTPKTRTPLPSGLYRFPVLPGNGIF